MSKFAKYFSLIILSFGFMGFLSRDNDIYYEISKNIDVFGRVYKEITLNYVDKVDPAKFMQEGIKGMLSSLDPYTVFIDASHKSDIDLITTGKYGGIGATIGYRDDNVTVVDLIEGYSAQRQGIRIGDVILLVDSTEINKDNYNDLGKYMKGKPGTEVKIIIRREGEEENLVFNLIREEIIVKNVSYYGFIPENSNNAYIKLSSFSRTAGEEVKDAIIDLKNQKKINSIVLDLRGNPGGLLDAAIDVSEKFLEPKKLIVSVASKDSLNMKSYYSKESPIAEDIPLTVLVNGGSASASEIVAGAIQDHDRGLIVGEKSFGKGLVQTVIPLSNNTSLKITTARYYTPSGRCIQKIDYSNNAKIFPDHLKKSFNSFLTDNKRVVPESSGILPDSIVIFGLGSENIKNLMAKGMFFKFATNFYNNNNIKNINSYSNDEIFEEFKSYLKKNKFEYVSEQERLLSSLSESLKDDDKNSEIQRKITDLKKLILAKKDLDLSQFKNEIVEICREELEARISGSKGRIRQFLKNDPQFHTAISLMDSKKLYNSILNAN